LTLPISDPARLAIEGYSNMTNAQIHAMSADENAVRWGVFLVVYFVLAILPDTIKQYRIDMKYPNLSGEFARKIWPRLAILLFLVFLADEQFPAVPFIILGCAAFLYRIIKWVNKKS
jgi:hypothetical protein